MPDPNSFFTRIGIWPKHLLPTRFAVRVLEHLASAGMPRLYVQQRDNGSITSSTSNGDEAPGFVTMIDSSLLSGRGYIELDRIAMQRCSSNMRVYRITDRGREALAQAAFRAEFERVLAQTVQAGLRKHREIYGLKE